MGAFEVFTIYSKMAITVLKRLYLQGYQFACCVLFFINFPKFTAIVLRFWTL